jgi:hypothetical protein
MDLLDLIVTIVECVAIGFGMEVGAVVAKAFAVRLLNGASPVTVHDVEGVEEDAEEEPEEEKSKRRRRAARGQGGASTPTAVRVM